MSDATSHEILAYEADPEEPLSGVPVDVLRSGLESPELRVRKHAAMVAASVAADDPDGAAAVVPTLVERLEDDSKVVVTKSTIALSVVAEERPAALEDAVSPLVDLLVDDLPLVRVFAARALGHVSVEHPEFLLGTEETLRAALSMDVEETIDSERLQEEAATQKNFESLNSVNVEGQKRQVVAKSVAANLLAEVADLEPERLRGELAPFVEALDDDLPTVVMASLDVVGQVARIDPEAAREAVEPVCDVLTRRNEQLVATAVTALGYIGDTRAVDPLEELADDEDREEDLRELAAETARFIEDAAS